MVSQFRAKAANYISTGSHGQLIVKGQDAAFRQKVINGWKAFELAHSRDLVPTPYFFEALDYVSKAKKLQTASLAGKRVPKVGDPLMEAIPIYNTVERRYAGFSNVPELLWYGHNAPKFVNGQHVQVMATRNSGGKGWKPWRQRDMFDPKHIDAWLYILLAHRITGSGASFEHDHGFRNNRIIEMQGAESNAIGMGRWLARFDGPIFTSIGNQIPPFNKPSVGYASGGRDYLENYGPELVKTAASST